MVKKENQLEKMTLGEIMRQLLKLQSGRNFLDFYDQEQIKVGDESYNLDEIKAKQEELLVELDKREKGYLRRDEPYR
jgi:hypothetical protein|tara:strand:+ start:118 stop:348 length:231 start_codon:yes stop_codon:yes gene_type:complete